MAAMSASTMAVLGASQVAVVQATSTSTSVSFSSGGAPSMAFVRARSVRPVVVRAGAPDDKPDIVSSTGGITEKAKQIAEDTASVLDGVKDDIEGSLTDKGRELKSKTGDVTYGARRNAEEVGNDVVQKANEAQTKFVKEK